MIMKFCFLMLAALISLGCVETLFAQNAQSDTTISETGQEQVGLQSAAERSVDWLEKQINPPSAEVMSTGGLQLFRDADTRQSAIKTGATLTLVLSLFFLAVFLWRLRPSSRKLEGRKRDNQVLTVLGQIPFVHGQQLQIVRLGTRLLLIAASPSGSQTLSEISDPQEVLQLESAIQQGRMDLLTASMQQRVLQGANSESNVSLGSHQRSGRTLLEA
ncbi:MAG: flagellar biosynthetic protein FliO [Pirellulaceae bacterium]|nr:flagellar biosynthetic protein FliO [Pirellulaceae bacterium]